MYIYRLVVVYSYIFTFIYTGVCKHFEHPQKNININLYWSDLLICYGEIYPLQVLFYSHICMRA